MIASYLKGFGQIMLQECAWTGVLFLAGLAVGSWAMLAGALLGALSGMLTARLFKLDSEDELRRGLFGFNGALVGIATFFFFPVSWLALLLIVSGSAFSSILMRWLLRWGRLPAYTAPFVVSAWGVLLAANAFGLPRNVLATGEAHGELAAVSRGVGQVMFQDNWLSGVLFLVGLLVNSRQAAVWAIIGSGIGLVCARGLGYPSDLVLAGVFGFNAALAAIALSERYPHAALAPFAGIVLSVVITRVFQSTVVPPLTAPFVLATWAVVATAALARKAARERGGRFTDGA